MTSWQKRRQAVKTNTEILRQSLKTTFLEGANAGSVREAAETVRCIQI